MWEKGLFFEEKQKKSVCWVLAGTDNADKFGKILRWVRDAKSLTSPWKRSLKQGFANGEEMLRKKEEKKP